MRFTKMRDSVPFGTGRHHCFELMSRSIALSSICSANNFSKFAFSSSRDFNLRVSAGFIPPYFDLYVIERRLPNPASPTNIGSAFPSLLFVQNLYDPFVAKSLLHSSVI